MGLDKWVPCEAHDKLTEKIGIFVSVKIWDADNDCCASSIDTVRQEQRGNGWIDQHLHATHTKNTRQSTLGLETHLQFPHKYNGQQAQSKIAKCCYHTVKVGDADKVVDVQTAPVTSPLPEKRDWYAL